MIDYDRPLFFHLMEYATDADRDVIDMVSGNPDWEPPPALRRGLKAYADGAVADFQYPPSTGLRELRREIAARRGVSPDRVIITNGAGEANYLAMTCALQATSGDEILLTDPVYPYYYKRTTMLDTTPRLVSVNDDGTLPVDAVRETASSDTVAIVINSPNNPTGSVYGYDTKQALLDVAETHDAVLISDEVYDHFVYEPGSFASALACESEHAIVTNSFSKSMAITGFRVGYGVFPEWLLDTVETRHMLVNVAGSRPAQHAVLQALTETDTDYFETNRELVGDRIDRFCTALADAGAQFTRPDGGFYVMAQFDDFPGTLANVKRLIDEAGVAGMPGEAFGDTHASWIRFALVTPRAEMAADRLTDYFT